jgi:serine/threonine protein kinase
LVNDRITEKSYAIKKILLEKDLKKNEISIKEDKNEKQEMKKTERKSLLNILIGKKTYNESQNTNTSSEEEEEEEDFDILKDKKFNEINLTSKLKNDNILSIQSYYIEKLDNDVEYLNFVMDYCEEGDLKNYQKKYFKKQTEIEKILIIIQILKGLLYVTLLL